jgi:class 3 adenylate cyclase
MTAPLERRWSWDFDLAPEALWPVLADTPRFNEAAGFPRYELQETAQPDGSVERVGRAKVGPLTLSWDEGDFDFVENHRFEQLRRFHWGPAKSLLARLELERISGGTRVYWGVKVEPRNAFWALLLRLFWLPPTQKRIDHLVRDGGAFARGERERPFDIDPPTFSKAGRERLAALRDKLDDPLAPALAKYLETGTDMDVARIRPKTLARAWGVPERAVTEVCLNATKAGMLEMRWDLLCPRCRGAKVVASSLDALPQGAHCSSCNVDYGRNFAKNVEVTFRCAPSIRFVGVGGFCLTSPIFTPHVRVQQRLTPGEVREIVAELGPGAWRVRTLEAGGEVDFDFDGGAFPEVILIDGAVRLGARHEKLVLRNGGKITRTVVIETREWVRDALTAHEVTTMQSFRDLFGEETLRPGDEVGIDQVTLMFTDLKGSTALYSRLGDAPAYGLVREHFAVLTGVVRRNDGAIVKTIGDAVMAAFADPADAVRAALQMHRDVAEFNERTGWDAIVLKVGLHAGPCIAVTLNDRLDYFGTTVNLAARLQDRSEGEDLILSANLLDDPAVAPLLEGLPLGAEVARIKGFDKPVNYLRLRLRSHEISTPSEAEDAVRTTG